MQTPFYHGAGGVLSADIAVSDHGRELEFYAAILTTGDPPLWQNDLLNSLGVPVIGLGPQSAETEHLPMQWMPHMQVADVAASVGIATSLGGRELMRDPSDQCQWAVLEDAAGATFGVIPIVEPSSAVRQLTGSICGLSLHVPQPEATAAFYEQVVGWTQDSSSTDSAEEPAEKNMLGQDNVVAARIMPQADANLPATWLIHLPVGDLQESLSRVELHSGQVLRQDPAGYCVIRDPAGVCLAITSGN